jgi:hypothetical protein
VNLVVYEVHELYLAPGPEARVERPVATVFEITVPSGGFRR